MQANETALVAGISVSLFQKERNLGEYEAHRARLDAIELQKQSNLRSLLHSVNQALGEHTRALLEVETIQLNVIPPLKEALDLVESAYLEGRFSYLEWVTTRQEFLTTRLTLIEAASQVHLSKTEIETLTGLALKTEHNDDSAPNRVVHDHHRRILGAHPHLRGLLKTPRPPAMPFSKWALQGWESREAGLFKHRSHDRFSGELLPRNC